MSRSAPGAAGPAGDQIDGARCPVGVAAARQTDEISPWSISGSLHQLEALAPGVAVTPLGTLEPLARISLGVERVGREGGVGEDLGRAEVTRKGLRLDYARDGLLETFELLDSGVEHSLVIAEPPAETGDLVIDVRIDGWQVDLADASPTRIEILDARTRQPLWEYAGLFAFDARQRPLPARMESLGTGIRIHVDDREAAYPIVIDPFLTSATWSLGPVGPAGIGVGQAISTGGDINRDGFTDLIVSNACEASAPGCVNQVQVHRGIPYFLFDGGGGLEATAAWTATGDSSVFPDGFGAAVASADVNGDGYSDLIVGAPTFLSDCTPNGLKKGRVLIWHGGPPAPGDPMGLGPTGTPANADAILRTPNTWNSFFCGATCTLPPPTGCAQAAGFGARIVAGDFNNDGIGDFAVGDPDRFGFEMSPSTPGGFGEVIVYRGNLAGPPTVFDQVTANSCATGSNCQNVNFGRELAVGDLDADQRDDLAVLAPGGSGAGVGNRRVWVYRGGVNQLSSFGDIVLPTLSYRAVGIGDVNFDGFGDIVVGGNNLIRAFHGSSSPFNVNDFVAESNFAYGGISWLLTGNPTTFNEDFGRSLTTADVNGDCYADVGVGAPQWPGDTPISANNAFGHLYLFEGSAAGIEPAPATVGGGGSTNAQIGTNVRSMDFEQNEFADLLSSSPSVNSGHGLVQVHRGYEAPGGIAMSPNPLPATTTNGNPLQILLGENGVAGFGDVAGPNILNLRLTAIDALDFDGHVALLFFGRNVLAVSANGTAQWSAAKAPSQFPDAVSISYNLFGVAAGSILDFAVQLDGAPASVRFNAGGSFFTGNLSGGPVSDCDGDGFRRDVDCDDARSAIFPTATERCDGLDNDCNHTYDEGFSVGGTCSVGLGICERFGQRICSADGLSSVCNATPGQPNPAGEICNGLNDDCDADGADEGNPGGGAACSTGAQGVCASGVRTCISGSLACVQTVQPSPEACNGFDDNCIDGTDEGNPGGGAACSTNLQGICSAGILTCSGGSLGCAQSAFPSAEICNGLDDDCSGGAPDVEAVDAPTWYPDVDSDGLGNPLGSQLVQCSQPPGHTSNDDDCNDTSAAVGAVCNTPPSSGQVVLPDASDQVTITLPNVILGGDTTVTVSPCLDGSGTPPVGIALNANSICVDVDTNATFTGEALVCINYDPAQYPNPLAVAMVRCPDPPPAFPQPACTLLIQDAAASGPGIYCARTSAFSSFALGIPTDGDADFTPDLADNCPAAFNFFQNDADLDRIGDVCDNCPRFATANVADADGDGRGNACECTDQNGDGHNDVTDLVAINLAIFNPPLATPLCDGNNDGACNVNDILAANIEIFSPTNTSTCARQPVPGP